MGLNTKSVTPQQNDNYFYAHKVPVGTVVRPSTGDVWMSVKGNRWVNLGTGFLGDTNGFLTGTKLTAGTEVVLVVEDTN